MKFFRLSDNAVIPKFATEYSACFDLHAALDPKIGILGYTIDNEKVTAYPNLDNKFVIEPYHRYLIPVDLIVDIDIGYEMKIYARSGLSLKQGLVLGNQTGVIDADYVDPLYVMLINISNKSIVINNHDRIAQAQFIKLYKDRTLEETLVKPEKKSSRSGGLGSTGVQKEVAQNKIEC